MPLDSRLGKMRYGESCWWQRMPCIAVAVLRLSPQAQAELYAHDEVAYDCHVGTGACELLVGHLRIVLLHFCELVVKVKVVRLFGHELTYVYERLHQQAVQFGGSVEVIALARVGSVGRIAREKTASPQPSPEGEGESPSL